MMFVNIGENGSTKISFDKPDDKAPMTLIIRSGSNLLNQGFKPINSEVIKSNLARE